MNIYQLMLKWFTLTSKSLETIIVASDFGDTLNYLGADD